MDNIEFIPSTNNCKYKTSTSKEWLSVLKQRWNLSYTVFREDDEQIVITHTRGGKHMVIVAFFDKVSKNGYIMDQRSKIRC